LPPLQRTIAPEVLTTHRRDLAVWQSPMFTSSMGHAVSAQAPSGTVDADGGGLAVVGVPAQRAAEAALPLLVPPRPDAARAVRRVTPPSAPVVAAESPPPSLVSAPHAPTPLLRPPVVPEPAGSPATGLTDASAPPSHVADILGQFANGGATYLPVPRPAAPAAPVAAAREIAVPGVAAPFSAPSAAQSSARSSEPPSALTSAPTSAPTSAAPVSASTATASSGAVPSASVRPIQRATGTGAPRRLGLGAPLGHPDLALQRAALPVVHRPQPEGGGPAAAGGVQPAEPGGVRSVEQGSGQRVAAVAAGSPPTADPGTAQDRAAATHPSAGIAAPREPNGSPRPDGLADPAHPDGLADPAHPDGQAAQARPQEDRAVRPEEPASSRPLPMPVAQRSAEPAPDTENRAADRPRTEAATPVAPGGAASTVAEQSSAMAGTDPSELLDVQRATGSVPLLGAREPNRAQPAQRADAAVRAALPLATPQPSGPVAASTDHATPVEATAPLDHATPFDLTASGAPESAADGDSWSAAGAAPLLGTAESRSTSVGAGSSEALEPSPLTLVAAVQRQTGLLGSRALSAPVVAQAAAAARPMRPSARTTRPRPAAELSPAPALGSRERPARARVLAPAVDLPQPANRRAPHIRTATPHDAAPSTTDHHAPRTGLPAVQRQVTASTSGAANRFAGPGDGHAAEPDGSHAAEPDGSHAAEPDTGAAEAGLPGRAAEPPGDVADVPVPVRPLDGDGGAPLALQRWTTGTPPTEVTSTRRLRRLGTHRASASQQPAREPEQAAEQPAQPEPAARPSGQPANEPATQSATQPIGQQAAAAIDVSRWEARDLDLLAGRLMEPITRRLKAELVVDRERRGLRSDPR
jgi:hypothetical protein